jgi:pSer/pThr/pTyr-binding forkhead associated (FHA) protein
MIIQNAAAIELFRNACGLSSPLSLHCEEAGQPTGGSIAQTFECPFVLVGRDSRSDLVLDSNHVSRRHAFLQAVGGRLYVVDLNSRSKVFWEGDKAPRGQGWLDGSRFIRIGPYVLRRAITDYALGPIAELQRSSPASEDLQNVSGNSPKAGLELPIRTGADASLWPLDRQFNLVGRSEECQLVVTDESVSRFHAALLLTHAGVWVVDLRATEGVHVNGIRVRWAWLGDGDTVRFGRLTFILRYELGPDRVLRDLVPLEAGASPPEPPGTELVVRSGQASIEPANFAVRRDESSPERRNVRIVPSSDESAAFVRSVDRRWDQESQYLQHPTMMWQQQMQMMESFHNDMILMVQMFVAMHREHLASVRDELDRVQYLTRELSELQAKLKDPVQSTDAGLTDARNAASAARKSSPIPRGTERHKKPESQKPNLDGGQRKPQPTKTGGRPVTRISEAHSTGDPAPAGSDQNAGVGESEFHALLTRRIAEIQRERQGYWKKILSALHS